MGNQYVEMGLSAPVNATWEVTYACNLSCIHCLSDSGRKREGELSTEAALQVIDQMAARKVFQFNIGGGEPFMRPDFLDLMDYAHDKKQPPAGWTIRWSIFRSVWTEPANKPMTPSAVREALQR